MELNRTKPVLIAGPTASGKSAAALHLATTLNGEVINADALQVYSGWHILSARPPAEDLAVAPHHLYGHRDMASPYSVGQWLRELRVVLDDLARRDKCPIIIGGTGLYFLALTQGLAEIPDIKPEIKRAADILEAEQGLEAFGAELETLDPKTAAKIDMQNPARTRRAWEVHKSTNQGLADWHENTPAPLIPEDQAQCLLLLPETETLNTRIDRRFDQMVDLGALEECRKAMDSFWNPKLPSCQAIGAKDLIAHLRGDVSLPDAIDRAKIQTRQYAKRQRTWFRARMKNWTKVEMSKAGQLISKP